MREAASFIASQSGSSESGLLNDVVTTVYRFVRAWQNRRALTSLIHFDEHMLADVGLTRADIRETLELPFTYDLGRELQYRATRNQHRGWNR
jgi:uncharacterized protein YjiS (DUF1127 family)